MTKFLPPHLPHLGEKYYRRGNKIQKSFYRITPKAIAMNEKNEILLIREGRYSDERSDVYRQEPAPWDLPGGGMTWGDDFRSGLIREMNEELGMGYGDDFILAEEPLYIQVSELDDRYYQNPEKDDFYPVLMVYFPVKFYRFDLSNAPKNTEFKWRNIDSCKEETLWSHVENITSIFIGEEFPQSYITHQNYEK